MSSDLVASQPLVLSALYFDSFHFVKYFTSPSSVIEVPAPPVPAALAPPPDPPAIPQLGDAQPPPPPVAV